jgi:phosphoglycolate phosphatase-like HAD superfamily hydrolase
MKLFPLECLRKPSAAAQYRACILDFDGTLSLIREGWQHIMIPYFTDRLCDTPKGRDMPAEKLYALAREFVFLHTGEQTIYQCIALTEEITKLGGVPEHPQAYKDEYNRRLMNRIDSRLQSLVAGTVHPAQMAVPGSHALLEALVQKGMTLYLASGTDEEHVVREAKLLDVDRFFGVHIYGAQREYRTFSKRMVIERILKDHQLEGAGLLGFGDGYVEIENVRAAGGTAVGVVFNEATHEGIDEWKRERLIQAGADALIQDYRDLNALWRYLYE